MNYIKIVAYIIWLLFIFGYIYIVYSLYHDYKKSKEDKNVFKK